MNSCLKKAKLGDKITLQWKSDFIFNERTGLPFIGVVIGFMDKLPIVGSVSSEIKERSILNYSFYLSESAMNMFNYATRCGDLFTYHKIKKN